MNALTVAQCIQLACLLEITASKPGNVNRGADFADLCFADFVASAVVMTPLLESPHDRSLGQSILKAVEATRTAVDTNTNLGIILLLAPLARIPNGADLRDGIKKVIASIDPSDTRDVYAAINLAAPGGMNQVEEHDLRDSPPESLLEAMSLAADRDLIARQFVNRFDDVFFLAETVLTGAVDRNVGLLDAIVWTHVHTMAKYPDSLIARKRGIAEAEHASLLARKAVDSATLKSDAITFGADYFRHIEDLDFWLRSAEGRNPGTSADMTTAAIFCALRKNAIAMPFRW